MGRPDKEVLDGVGVLVTRPEYQQQNLVELIEQLGGQAFQFPTLDITPTDQQKELFNTLHSLEDYDIAVFVSPNAARYVFDALRSENKSLPKKLLLACVGKGCSNAVQENGYSIDATPVEGVGSDGLLKNALLQTVKNKRIVIFRGNGGRELLAETLQKRGATVDYCECYQRRIPDSSPDKLISHWQQKGINIVTITSTQALKNLWTMLGINAVELIAATPMIVISSRIADAAEKLGCEDTILVTNDTSDASIVDAIKQWRLKKKTL